VGKFYLIETKKSSRISIWAVLLFLAKFLNIFVSDLSHFLPVDLRHEGLFREEDGVFLGVDPEHVPEGVLPEQNHVVPTVHATPPQRLPHGQKFLPLHVGLVAHVKLAQVEFGATRDLNMQIILI